MAATALKRKPEAELKTYHATVLVTRAEEWCVEAETPEAAHALSAAGLSMSPWRADALRSRKGGGVRTHEAVMRRSKAEAGYRAFKKQVHRTR